MTLSTCFVCKEGKVTGRKGQPVRRGRGGLEMNEAGADGGRETWPVRMWAR